MHSACGRAKDAKPLGCFTMRSSCLLPSCLRSHNSNNNNKKKSSTHNNNGFGTHLNCNRSLILICQQGQPIKPKRGNVSVPSCEVPKKMLKGKISCKIYLKIIFLFHFIFIIYIFIRYFLLLIFRYLQLLFEGNIYFFYLHLYICFSFHNF